VLPYDEGGLMAPYFLKVLASYCPGCVFFLSNVCEKSSDALSGSNSSFCYSSAVATGYSSNLSSLILSPTEARFP